jgi:hypothetical protein
VVLDSQELQILAAAEAELDMVKVALVVQVEQL